jgi:hypothetical protein
VLSQLELGECDSRRVLQRFLYLSRLVVREWDPFEDHFELAVGLSLLFYHFDPLFRNAVILVL